MTLNIDQLMNCEEKLSHSWELFCSKDQMSLRCEEAVQLAPDMWTRHDTFILNFGVRCGRPGQSGQEVWDISLTPWVISEGNGFTQFKPVKNTEQFLFEIAKNLYFVLGAIAKFLIVASALLLLFCVGSFTMRPQSVMMYYLLSYTSLIHRYLCAINTHH